MTKKVALITGGSQGIGRGIAKAFAQNGYHVIIVARTENTLQDVADEITALGGDVTAIAMDITDANAVSNMAKTIQEKFGKLDALIGNAALLGDRKHVQNIEPQHFSDVFSANVLANQLLICHCHNLLMESKYPRAVFITTSPAGVEGRANFSLYGSTKAALETIARSYADENSDTALRVNLVNPGRVRTKMRAETAPTEDPMTIPTPDEIADVFLELCSKAYTRTAETIVIDRKPAS